jgi:excisionase family DNA binding protein
MFQEEFVNSLADAVAARVIAQMSSTGAKQNRLMSVTDAAAYLGRSRQAVYHLANQGKLPFKKQGTRVFFDRVELDRWINDLND